MTSTNVVIRNNSIKDFRCFNKEIPAAVENNTVVLDARGSVFQLYNTITNKGITFNTTDGTYIRNVVADSQIMVAKAIKDGMFLSEQGNPLLSTNISTIPKEIIEWAEGIPTGTPLRPPRYLPLYRCNGDSMHHVAKGIVVIRLEQTYVTSICFSHFIILIFVTHIHADCWIFQFPSPPYSLGFTIENNTIDGVINLSAPAFGDCYDFHVLADAENANQCQTGNIRGISVAGTR